MSIWRGAQSAIFFYLSCAPCSDARYRKARARAAAHTHAERAVTKSRHPDYPDQAPPGSINPFWQAEIEAGPKICKKEWKDAKERREREGQRGKGEKWFLVGGREGVGEGSTEMLEGVRDGGESGKREQRLKRTHSAYQRADEELWGTHSSSTNPPPTYRADSHLASTSTLQLPSRPTTARTATPNPHAYHQDRHPAVNELHPPTTRKITSKEEVAWMLQPLPVAAVMRGQEPPNASVGTCTAHISTSTTNLDPAAARSQAGSSAGGRRSLTSLVPKPSEKVREGTRVSSGETAVGTPESRNTDANGDESEVEDVEDEVPERWVYAQTRREVQARRSLEW